MDASSQASETKLAPYFANFDGIRAIAIIAVILVHSSYGHVLGHIGVDLFFFLSGFLITTLLITEHANAGRISLSKFYVRRLLRLYPGLLGTIVLIFITWRMLPGSAQGEPSSAALSSLLYYANLVPEAILGPLTSCWSLSVEEHFYFFWPPLLAWLISSPKSSRKLAIPLVICFSFAAASMALRIFLYHIDATYPIDPYRFTLSRLDAIMMGAGFGILATTYPSVITKFFRSSILLWTGIALFVMLILIGRPVYSSWSLSTTLLICCAAIVVPASTLPVQSILCNSVMTWIGKRSYGIYLYHVPIILLLEPLRIKHSVLNFALILAMRFMLTFIVAEMSYRLIELPFLRWKRRINPIAAIDAHNLIAIRKFPFLGGRWREGGHAEQD